MRGLLRDEIRCVLDAAVGGRRPSRPKPWVVFVVGVNGVGKTTTIGKLAAAWKSEGRSTLLLRRRHLPGRRGRAARGLGAAHGRAVPSRARGRRSERRS